MGRGLQLGESRFQILPPLQLRFVIRFTYAHLPGIGCDSFFPCLPQTPAGVGGGSPLMSTSVDPGLTNPSLEGFPSKSGLIPLTKPRHTPL